MSRKEYKQREKENGTLLKEFESWLNQKGLKLATVENHTSNVEFYLNAFLNDKNGLSAKQGAEWGNIANFLGDWFIRKATWSSSAHIRDNASSFKKFYTFMHEKGLIEKVVLDDVKDTIKRMMPDWIKEIEVYESELDNW
jgi:site-specific recombinase XerD